MVISMDSKLVHTFVVAAQENNLTKAAQSLGYAQSTVTTQIKLLEEELHLTLFDRFGKSVFLSTDGKAFLPYAKQLLRMEQDMKDKFSRSPEFSPLTIGASQSLSNALLPNIVGRFQMLYPQTPLTINLQDSAHLRSLLLTNEIDVALCMKHNENQKDLLSYETRKEPISLFVGVHHPARKTKSLTLESLCFYPFVLTAKDCYYHKVLTDLLESRHLAYHVFLESDNVTLLKQFALKGLGIAFLPDIAVEEEINAKKLVKITPIDTPSFISESQILLHRQKYINISLQRFLDIAKEYMQTITL